MADKSKVFEVVFSAKGLFFFFADDKGMALDHANQLALEAEFGRLERGPKFVGWMTSQEFTAFDEASRK